MKGILVFNMPNKCSECPCAYEWANKCNATDKAIIDFNNVPDWCKIRPLPEKANETVASQLFGETSYAKGCVDGYNECLDEILGEIK